MGMQNDRSCKSDEIEVQMKPNSVNILGITYSIEYVDKPSDVDIYKRDSMWGQIDYWTRSIRVYDNGRPIEDVFETVLHETIHGIAEGLKIKSVSGDEGHDDLSLLSLALSDVLFRNGWIKTERSNQ
jgi:hypothetical protein